MAVSVSILERQYVTWLSVHMFQPCTVVSILERQYANVMPGLNENRIGMTIPLYKRAQYHISRRFTQRFVCKRKYRVGDTRELSERT
jgi:hypothetical protein